jgi:hypothetical protein
MADAGAQMRMITGTGTILLDSGAVSGISGSGDAEISIRAASSGELTEAQRNKVGNGTAIDVSVRTSSGTVSKLNGTATVTVPYVLEAGRDPGLLRVWYIDAEGNTAEHPSSYDAGNGTVAFTTDHFSLYAIVYLGEDQAQGQDKDDSLMLYIGTIIILMISLTAGLYAYRRYGPSRS